MVACSQCRQRKVRCKGDPTGCEACKRLGFQCSLSPNVTHATSISQPSTALRKRGARACDSCRAQRSRCSGEVRCSRCQQLNIECHYTLSVRQYRVEERQKRIANAIHTTSSQGWETETDRSTHSTPPTTSEALVSPATPAFDSLERTLGCDRRVIRQHIDAYFEYIYPVPIFSFLHRAELLSQFTAATIYPALLLAICGLSARFMTPSKERGTQAKSWIELAEKIVFRDFGKINIANVQTLMLLELHQMYDHRNSKCFLYLALAVRVAYSLKLHKEDRQLSFLEQESRRRLLWCMFALDRLHAGGVPEYVLLPASSIHVQLPYLDHLFQADMTVTTPHLEDLQGPSGQLSINAFLLRVFHIRNQVLQYTKQLLNTSASPESTIIQFRGLERNLHDVLDSLPPELVFSTRAYQLRAFSPERTTFITLHLYFHHCHCELYRLLNPGYREALPDSVIKSTSPELVAYAQGRCLEHAVFIGEMIVSTYELADVQPYSSDCSCFVILYQASCAILYACHRDSPAYIMDAVTARPYFVAFILTLQSLLRFFPRYAIYVDDIRNMLRSIDEPNAPLPPQKALTEVDFRARMVPSEENSDEDSTAGGQPPPVPFPDVGAIERSQNTVPGAGAHLGFSDLALPTNISTEDQYPMFSGIGVGENDMEFTMELHNELLWDWANALGPAFDGPSQ